MRNWIHKIKKFFQEVLEEIQKCTRPSSAELKESTVVVVVTMAILGIFIFTSDFAIGWILSLIISH